MEVMTKTTVNIQKTKGKMVNNEVGALFEKAFDDDVDEIITVKPVQNNSCDSRCK